MAKSRVDVERKDAKIISPEEARAIIGEGLKSTYGKKVKVEFLRAELETDLSGRKLWAVEGIIHVRRWPFRRKCRRFTYYMDAENGKILFMRMRKD